MACRRTGATAFDRASLLFPYRGDFRKILTAWKFGGQPWLGRFLAECLQTALMPLEREERDRTDTAWVPVPPRPGKIRKAGWDQVESLARFLEQIPSAVGALPVCRCLARLPSQAQKTLGREDRRRNLAGNIRVKPSWAGRIPAIAVLFDDVYTTGSTLDACAAALKTGGARKVYGVCLFYD
jgi:ComF family protein